MICGECGQDMHDGGQSGLYCPTQFCPGSYHGTAGPPKEKTELVPGKVTRISVFQQDDDRIPTLLLIVRATGIDAFSPAVEIYAKLHEEPSEEYIAETQDRVEEFFESRFNKRPHHMAHVLLPYSHELDDPKFKMEDE